MLHLFLYSFVQFSKTHIFSQFLWYPLGALHNEFTSSTITYYRRFSFHTETKIWHPAKLPCPSDNNIIYYPWYFAPTKLNDFNMFLMCLQCFKIKYTQHSTFSHYVIKIKIYAIQFILWKKLSPLSCYCLWLTFRCLNFKLTHI